MTIYSFRKRLAEHLHAMADEKARINGKSRNRSAEDRFFYSGESTGITEAAKEVLTFLTQDDEE